MRGGVDGIGNPGMVCARAFDGRGRSTFTSGAEDAFGDRDARAAKGDAVFFSIVACACSRGERVMSAQAG